MREPGENTTEMVRANTGALEGRKKESMGPQDRLEVGRMQQRKAKVGP